MNHYEHSKQLLAEAKNYLAGGVSSSLRAAMQPVPLYASSASGSRLIDVDGNTYIDYLLAYGPLILGHAHPVLTTAITQAMQAGCTYGLQHEAEIALARKLTELMPAAEKVVFSGSGTEAVMLALRLSRAYTGRSKIVRFQGHYHGWSDSIFTSFPSSDMRGGEMSNAAIEPGTSGQSANSLSDIIVLPWNDEAAFIAAIRAHGPEIAAVITEPVMCNSGCIQPKTGYLELLRSITAEHHIVLIFDEVITGFRLGLGGAHAHFSVTPDLVTVGKALGGGIALSAVVGSHAIMDLVTYGHVSHLGTLNGNGAAMAAGLAVLRELSKEDGAVYLRMEQLTHRLTEGLRELLIQHRIKGLVNQIGPVFNLMFTDAPEVSTFDAFNARDALLYAKFAEKLLDEGVLVRSNGLWYISAAHTEADIEATLEAVDRAFGQLKIERSESRC
ncbi:aspartate aminotransferase family protein [Paenibacillus sp. OV219]|uniref:aspartate aminotransferase family protein n=1 Tax=Paenibacillus sp. OV219 TaxID=1884377 RepID=UPI0008B78FC1|nr:aspartate aminotransferase family protein [Paenibacillus sp. OV219]SEO05297.1 glutamate-1-semialdehyde 2,1-aminomutase [Paenibacillus sp. OV219]